MRYLEIVRPPQRNVLADADPRRNRSGTNTQWHDRYRWRAVSVERLNRISICRHVSRIYHPGVCYSVDGCTDPRKSGAECLNWWGDIGRREALAERHVCDCWIGDGVSSGAMRRCGACAA